ncbi:Uu.00g104040.m01.CDS01 [Anthostomella pinea]|uniref:Uu.00g104040.m01.CDS01 n=1 Tax=Anthostomella pinea TaxID=933095 RepID=A0AAI8VDS1_9PEZI|nr:Uu.00g104040.m01.CDS01 [Anthostomella pinea]
MTHQLCVCWCKCPNAVPAPLFCHACQFGLHGRDQRSEDSLHDLRIVSQAVEQSCRRYPALVAGGSLAFSSSCSPSSSVSGSSGSVACSSEMDGDAGVDLEAEMPRGIMYEVMDAGMDVEWGLSEWDKEVDGDVVRDVGMDAERDEHMGINKEADKKTEDGVVA